MGHLKLFANLASSIFLLILIIFAVILFSAHAGILDLESESNDGDQKNKSTVPEVASSNYPGLAGERLELALYEEVNERRLVAGEEALEHSERVRLIARLHSKDMADREYFAHESPEGKGPSERHSKYGGCKSIKENAAMFGIPANETAEIAEVIVDGWSNSPGHKEAMLSEHVYVTGVGVHVTADGIIYATQNFCWEHPSA